MRLSASLLKVSETKLICPSLKCHDAPVLAFKIIRENLIVIFVKISRKLVCSVISLQCFNCTNNYVIFVFNYGIK